MLWGTCLGFYQRNHLQRIRIQRLCSWLPFPTLEFGVSCGSVADVFFSIDHYPFAGLCEECSLLFCLLFHNWRLSSSPVSRLSCRHTSYMSSRGQQEDTVLRRTSCRVSSVCVTVSELSFSTSLPPAVTEPEASVSFVMEGTPKCTVCRISPWRLKRMILRQVCVCVSMLI